jgi:hypothetical protein
LLKLPAVVENQAGVVIFIRNVRKSPVYAKPVATVTMDQIRSIS